MILYNVTVKVEATIEKDWLDWMKTVHVPDVMKTGMFADYKICRVLGEEAENTFSFQYFAHSTEHLQKYQKDHAPQLQKEHSDRYKDKFVAFRTLLEVIESHK
ncbi:MAG: hypothetical protein ACI81S_002037 [Sphingobacteriales bacterium]